MYVLGPAIGVLDRHDRKKDNDWCRFNYRSSWCSAIVAFCVELPVWMIMTSIVIRSITDSFSLLALNAVTPLLTPEENG